MLAPAGLPAAPYIHILALTAMLAIILPRAILAALATARLRTRERLTLDLDEPYFARLVDHGRALQLEAISEPMALQMKIESAKLAEAVAVFVRDQLYDERVVPVLRRFRDEGGRIADLEAELATTCEGFTPALERFVASAHDDFVRALAARAARLIGTDPVGHESVATRPELRTLPSAGSGNPAGALSAELTDAITVAVSTAVALAAGAVSGGIGHSLGIAIISTLLHTTGPVGFLIGALGAFAITAGLLDLSRESVGEWTKSVRLPSAALRVLLRDSKLESLITEGRARAYADVKAQVTRDLDASGLRCWITCWRARSGAAPTRRRAGTLTPGTAPTRRRAGTLTPGTAPTRRELAPDAWCCADSPPSWRPDAWCCADSPPSWRPDAW